MRVSPTQPPVYCGLALPARTMALGLLPQDGASLVPRLAGPAPLLHAVAPSRADGVVWVACLCPWYWLAARWARAGLSWGLGQAHNDPREAQTMALLWRGGLRPQASVSPAQRRSPRLAAATPLSEAPTGGGVDASPADQ